MIRQMVESSLKINFEFPLLPIPPAGSLRGKIPFLFQIYERVSCDSVSLVASLRYRTAHGLRNENRKIRQLNFDEIWRNHPAFHHLAPAPIAAQFAPQTRKMSLNGVLQLKKLQVVYSNWGGSSNQTRYVACNWRFFPGRTLPVSLSLAAGVLTLFFSILLPPGKVLSSSRNNGLSSSRQTLKSRSKLLPREILIPTCKPSMVRLLFPLFCFAWPHSLVYNVLF